MRLPDEGKIAGVCAGLAAYFDVDVTVVRLVWVILSIVPGVFIGGLVAYIAAWILTPVARPQDHVLPVGRLARSETDKQIAGVCGGLAEFFGVDSTIVRLAAVPGQAVDHPVDQILVMVDELGKRRIVLPAPAALDERLFIGLVHPPPSLERHPGRFVSLKQSPAGASLTVAYEAGAQ